MKLDDILRTLRHFRSTIPVDVEGLALALGIKVRKGFLGPKISGVIERIDDGFEIEVNADHPQTRQRFTIAHEIGHFVLHRALMGDGNVDDCVYRSDGSVKNNRIGPRQETQANKFAAWLLMPSEAIAELRKTGIDDARTMARRLDVSEGAMKIRLGIA